MYWYRDLAVISPYITIVNIALENKWPLFFSNYFFYSDFSTNGL